MVHKAEQDGVNRCLHRAIVVHPRERWSQAADVVDGDEDEEVDEGGHVAGAGRGEATDEERDPGEEAR